MSGIEAQFYDGRTSVPVAVRLAFDGSGNALVSLPAEQRHYPRAALRIHDRIGALAPRTIDFSDGAVAHVPPDAESDRLLDALSGGAGGWVRRLEARWLLALAALVICTVSIAAFIHYGLPALATFVADRTPPAFEIELGRKTLEDLDEGLLQTSELPVERQRTLRTAFEQQVARQAASALTLRLEFRASKAIGANALALPGGIVVLIDDIVELAEHDEELLTVLAHEVGHVVGRHAFKQLLEGLGITLIMTAITGDISGPASLAAALPALLLHAGYSRRYEREADDYAFAWADAHGVARSRLTDLLLRLEEKYNGLSIPNLLSTHPSSEERSRAAATAR